MPLVLQNFAAGDLNYVSKMNSNNAQLISSFNSLESQILASVGEGAQLLLDLWDRPGIVGSHSYVLDIPNYAGAALITIGRRPTFDPLKFEVDQSVAFGVYGGQKVRVVQNGDVILNAASIVTGLPKDIWVGVGSDGTAQLFESDILPNVTYLYRMCWDGFSLTGFTRIAHLLPAYPLIQAIAGAPRMVQIHDAVTDFAGELDGQTELMLPGAREDNEIDVDGSMEVLGFFLLAARSGDDGFNAPTPSILPTDPIVSVKVVSEGKDWTLTPFDIDAGSIPDQIFRKINLPVIGNDRFVTTVRRFSLERTFKGPAVTSARNFTWGMLVRPLIGIAIPKDTAKVELV